MLNFRLKNTKKNQYCEKKRLILSPKMFAQKNNMVQR